MRDLTRPRKHGEARESVGNDVGTGKNGTHPQLLNLLIPEALYARQQCALWAALVVCLDGGDEGNLACRAAAALPVVTLAAAIGVVH